MVEDDLQQQPLFKIFHFFLKLFNSSTTQSILNTSPDSYGTSQCYEPQTHFMLGG